MPSAEIERLLARDFITRYPSEAAEHLERLPPAQAAEVLTQLEPRTCAKAFRSLTTTSALDILTVSAPDAGGKLLPSLAPSQAVTLVEALPESKREELLGAMSSSDAREIRALSSYPPQTAGRLRNTRFAAFRASTTVREALAQSRSRHTGARLHSLLVVDEVGRLVGSVPLHEAALAEPGTMLSSLVHAPPVSVSGFASRGEVVEIMEQRGLDSLPVVAPDGVPIGVIRIDEVLHEVGEELSADLVSITGASRDETALSGPQFAVRKRLPWLIVNLVTAFLAATVVGIFENTIAQFTALAVLLPVVAGQSGNTGSQALAVALRGLALREITSRYWPRIVVKELVAGAINGVGVGIVTCAAVYIWSGSLGLVLVIGTAMLLSMTIAGIAGAVIPLLLGAIGQDPAQSSSILLTTVTDIVGFLSFLGFATLFAGLI